ncbi:hypothetical protein RJT34_18594 [Clitoria ternatea]|uniref:Uncharacterized protein n=1 Tax=Clitoria ternatea TaxID=43366 RepID=A0AAN9PEF6_CLITE
MAFIYFSREGGINTNSAEVSLLFDLLFTLANSTVDDELIHNCNFVICENVENSDLRFVTSVYIYSDLEGISFAA